MFPFKSGKLSVRLGNPQIAGLLTAFIFRVLDEERLRKRAGRSETVARGDESKERAAKERFA